MLDIPEPESPQTPEVKQEFDENAFLAGESDIVSGGGPKPRFVTSMTTPYITKLLINYRTLTLATSQPH